MCFWSTPPLVRSSNSQVKVKVTRSNNWCHMNVLDPKNRHIGKSTPLCRSEVAMLKFTEMFHQMDRHRTKKMEQTTCPWSFNLTAQRRKNSRSICSTDVLNQCHSLRAYTNSANIIGRQNISQSQFCVKYQQPLGSTTIFSPHFFLLIIRCH